MRLRVDRAAGPNVSRLVNLEDLLARRLDSCRVAVFDLLQGFQAVSEFEAIAVYRLDPSESSLTVEAVVRSQTDSSVVPGLQPGATLPVDGSFEEDVAALRSYLVVPDTQSDSHFAQRGASMGVGSYVGFPLSRTDGSLYGILSGYGSRPRPVARAVTTASKAFAREIAAELEVAESIDAVLKGEADPWELLQGFGAVARIAGKEAGSDETEAATNAARIVAAACGFDVRTPARTGAGGSVELSSEDFEPAPNVWPARVDDVVGRADELLPRLPGARIDARPAAAGVAVDMDLRTLERVVANLLLHAWRSSPPGTPILVSSLREGKWVELSVEDKSGLTPVESLARRMHPAGSRRIGLPVAQALVEEAGGRISQVPTEDGRRYVVRLPVLENDGKLENGPGGTGRSAKGA